ncbi:MAG: hypothetical protein ACO2ZM_08745 [Francisellaceae bacterium]
MTPTTVQTITADGTYTDTAEVSQLQALAPNSTMKTNYYPVVKQLEYFKPASDNSVSHILPISDQTDDTLGYLLKEIDYDYGSGDSNQEARLYGKTEIDHTVSDLSAKTNSGGQLSLNPVKSTTLTYAYCDASDSNLAACSEGNTVNGVTISAISDLGSSGSDSTITNEYIYDNASDLLQVQYKPKIADTQNGYRANYFTYDALNRPITEQSYVLQSLGNNADSNTLTKDITLNYPNLLERVSINNLTGDQADVVFDSQGHELARFDNAAQSDDSQPLTCDDTTGVTHSVSGLCPVGIDQYNAQGEKTAAVSYFDTDHDANGNNAYSRLYYYDDEQRLINQLVTSGSNVNATADVPATHGQENKTGYDDIWTDPDSQTPVSLQISYMDNGNQGTIDSDSYEPVTVTERDLNTGDEIASFKLKYTADIDTDPIGFVEAAITNKSYELKQTFTYNAEHNVITTDTIHPNATTYSSDATVTSQMYYSAKGQRLQSTGPMIDTMLSDSSMSNDLTGSSVTMYQHYNALGAAICMAMGVTQDQCD